MKMRKFNKLASLFLASALVLGACKKDEDPTPVNEQEVITKVTVRFTNVADASDVVTFVYDDEDGFGPNPAIITNGELKKNAVYDINVTIAGEDGEDITKEIKEEADEHQIYYGFSPNTSFPVFSYLDKDSENRPVGLRARATTINGSGGGNFQMILIHKPNKSLNNTFTPWVYSPNIGGEQDFNILFSLTIR
jgi:hypothetical protein